MSKFIDVTLVGISCEFTSDGRPIEISGTLVAKTLTRERIEKSSEVLFVSDTPVTIAVGNTLAINKTVRVALSTDAAEIPLFGENLALGGKLSVGGPSHLIIPTFSIASEIATRHDLRFASDDGAQHVRADFVVKVAHFG